MVVQKVLVIVAVLSVPVLLLGKPMQEYITHRMKRTQLSVSTASEFCVCVCVCLYITALSASVGRQTSSAGGKRLYKCSPGRGGYKRRRRRGGKREVDEANFNWFRTECR